MHMTSRIRRSLSCPALLAAASACSATDITGVSPVNGQTLTPPDAYPVWFKSVSACSGFPGEFSAFRFVLATPASQALESRVARKLVPMMLGGAQRVAHTRAHAVETITVERETVRRAPTVSRAMLDGLMRLSGETSPAYLARCASIVDVNQSECAAVPPVVR